MSYKVKSLPNLARFRRPATRRSSNVCFVLFPTSIMQAAVGEVQAQGDVPGAGHPHRRM
jgi:hypothetical protein